MRWVVSLHATREDADRLAGAFPHLSVVGDLPSAYHRELHLELDSPGGAATDDRLDIGRAAVEAHVRRMNGFGRLRWGRTFEGVQIRDLKTIDSDGEATTIVFLEPAVEYLLPEDWIAGAEARGIPRARLPVGIEALTDLDGVAIAMLASVDHHVALVLRLVDEMLAGEEEIDWGAAYSALEVIEQDLKQRGLKGQDLGWWTVKERDNFRATANSVEVLGEHARHGKPFGLTAPRTTSADASWLVRRVAASWLTWRLQQDRLSAE